MRRVGILGGTFDPIHFGHLVAAQEVAEQLALSCVTFVPAAQPPHKLEQKITPAEHRLAMVALAIRGNPAFEMSTIEMQLPGPSYTVHTLGALKAASGQAAELYYIVGGDAPGDLHTWYEPARLLDLATLVVIERPGFALPPQEQLARQLNRPRSRLRYLTGPLLDISSTELRARARAGKSLRYLVPDEVIAYIAAHRLYDEPVRREDC